MKGYTVTIALERPAEATGSSQAPLGGAASTPHSNTPVRDRSIDTVRAVLLVIVVALHSMMVGVSVGVAGPVLRNALENQVWFAPVSWVVQIMPLFFIVGGFASIRQWRSLRERETSAASYVRGRIDRLVRPAIALVAVVGAALLTMTVLGVPAELVATASLRIGQPLWFLGVYILCSALVPLMVRAHEVARLLTPVLLLGAVIAVDAVRLASGIEAIGFLNLLFVWLLVQQLGFWLADGHIDSLARRTRSGIIAAAVIILMVLTAGPYSADMLVNLNPPTLCLVVLGVVQLMVFSLLRPRIAALAERPVIRRFTGALGQRAMTVYLWHMPVLIVLAATLLVLNATSGVILPEPLSLAWWAGRPLWLIVVGLAVVPVARLFSRFERGRRMPRTAAVPVPTALSASCDTVLGAAGVATALIAGFGVAPASLSLVLLLLALGGTRRLGVAAAIAHSRGATARSRGATARSRAITPHSEMGRAAWN
jgi:fucose 4-O-acetylase-like acetyltransferase